MGGTAASKTKARDAEHFDISPFTAATLWTGGQVENWPKLRKVLEPLVSREFAITRVSTQVFADVVQQRLDSSTDDFGNGVVHRVVLSEADGDAEMLKAVLEAGADPDLPNWDGWRPSHICGCYARVDAAAAIFLCRPDVTAVNENGDTPLAAARVEKYQEDHTHPGRQLLRNGVEKVIIDGRYNLGQFPSIAELSCGQKWFAVRNLIRREVVPASEYSEKYHGKSAAEWARTHEEENIAKEIEYFAKPAKIRIREAAAEKEDEIRGLKAKIAEDGKRMAERLETPELQEAEMAENLIPES